MSEKERKIKKIYAGETDEETVDFCGVTDFSEELCEACKKFSYCIPSNCANCEFRTKCTYVYESF